MIRRIVCWVVLAPMVAGAWKGAFAGDNAGGLTSAASIALPGIEGRIDHFAWDAKRRRLLMAALGNNTVEIIDVAGGKDLGQIKDLKTPQGVAVSDDGQFIAVANDADGSCRIFDGGSLKQLRSVDLRDDADNVRYDAEAKLFWVGYGDGAVAALQPESGRVAATVKLEGHPESFQLEATGKRIFVNVPSAKHVAVIDRDKNEVVARWPLTDAAANFPMALDEAHHRLLVGCRKPAKLLALDTETGRAVAAVDIVGDTDDLFYDSQRRRIYVTGGAGALDIIEQADADTYRRIASLKTAFGARTSFFVPTLGKLLVAVPHRGEQQAELRVFETGEAK